MIITKELMNKGKNSNGAWSNKQVRLLGEPDGMIDNPGWQKRVIGRYISDVDAERFVALKDAHLKKGNRKRGRQNHHGRTGAEILEWIEENQFVSYDDEDDVVAVVELKAFFGIGDK